MDHIKEIELEILENLNEAPDGIIRYEAFIELFPSNPDGYNAAFNGLRNQGYTFITNGYDLVFGHHAQYRINEQGKLRLSQLQKEKAEEEFNKVIQTQLVEDSAIVKRWTQKTGWGTIILIFLTVVIVLMTGYLIYLEKNPPISKGLTPEQQIELQRSWDFLAKAKIMHDSTVKADTVPRLKK